MMAQSRPVLQAYYGEIFFVPPPSVLTLVVTFSLYKHKIELMHKNIWHITNYIMTSNNQTYNNPLTIEQLNLKTWFMGDDKNIKSKTDSIKKSTQT